MGNEFLGDRRTALEDTFFHKKDRELLEKLRAESQVKEKKGALAAASGFTNDALLDGLLAAGIESETFAAVTLAPLVAVAWADHEVQADEREQILASAVKTGMAVGSAGYALLQGWLERAPGPELMTAWKDYVGALRQTLDAGALKTLKDEVMGRARHVARAAGGVMGFGRISAAEHGVLDELERAFS